MVARGIPCLGPVTQSGCGALCPTYGRGCYGCFGPREQANAASLSRTFVAGGREGEDVSRLFAGFTGWAPPFRAVIGEFGGPPGMTPDANHGRRPRWPRLTARGSPAHRPASASSTSPTSPAWRARAASASACATARSSEARLRIFEAPRYFERLVVGRTGDEVIDIVARICGICPIAYQMSRGPRVRGPLRRGGRPGQSGRSGGSSTAASGSRATRSTCTCSMLPTSWATRPPSRWRPTTGPMVEQGLAIKKVGNAADRGPRRPARPPDLRPRRRLLARALAA